MRMVVLGIALLGSACSSSTKPQDAALGSPLDARPDTGEVVSIPLVDASPCFTSCEAVTHPEICKPFAYWQVSLDLVADGGGCATRASVPCSFDANRPLQLMDLLESCGFPGSESTVVVTFSEGCATHLYSYGVGDFATACYAELLATSRFDCVDQIPCLEAHFSTLVPTVP
jgi:hypothetical protein